LEKFSAAGSSYSPAECPQFFIEQHQIIVKATAQQQIFSVRKCDYARVKLQMFSSRCLIDFKNFLVYNVLMKLWQHKNINVPTSPKKNVAIPLEVQKLRPYGAIEIRLLLLLLFQVTITISINEVIFQSFPF